MIYLYKITNIINGKIYFGQTKDPNKRWKRHLALAKWEVKRKSHIYSAMRKYGSDNFIFEILAEFETQEEVDNAEIEAIANYKTQDQLIGYNIAPGGRVGGSGPLSKEAKEKISKAHKGRKFSEEQKRHVEACKKKPKKYWDNLAEICRNKTQETKDKISATLTGKKWTEERKQKFADLWNNLSEEEKEYRLQLLEAARKLFPPQSKETKQKIIDFHTGRKRSEETCKKMSEKRKEYWAKVKSGELPAPLPPPKKKSKTHIVSNKGDC